MCKLCLDIEYAGHGLRHRFDAIGVETLYPSVEKASSMHALSCTPCRASLHVHHALHKAPKSKIIDSLGRATEFGRADAAECCQARTLQDFEPRLSR